MGKGTEGQPGATTSAASLARISTPHHVGVLGKLAPEPIHPSVCPSVCLSHLPRSLGRGELRRVGPAGVQLEIITLIKNCLLELLLFDGALPRQERARKTHKTSSLAVPCRQRCGAGAGAESILV